MSRLDSRARKLLELRETNALAQKAAKDAKRELDLYEAEFWSELEDLSLKSFTLELEDEDVLLKRSSTRYSEILDEELLIESLTERGIAREFFKASVRKGNLNRFIKTLQEHGEDLPPGLGWRDNRYISVTHKRRRITG